MFIIRKIKIKMADRKKHVLSQVVKNIIFHKKTLLVTFYRHNKTFWYTVRPLFKTLHNTVKHMNLPTVV